MIKFLVEMDADMDVSDNELRTPLLLSASRRHWESMKMLVDLGANYMVKVRDLKLRIMRVIMRRRVYIGPSKMV